MRLGISLEKIQNKKPAMQGLTELEIKGAVQVKQITAPLAISGAKNSDFLNLAGR